MNYLNSILKTKIRAQQIWKTAVEYIIVIQYLSILKVIIIIVTAKLLVFKYTVKVAEAVVGVKVWCKAMMDRQLCLRLTLITKSITMHNTATTLTLPLHWSAQLYTSINTS